MSSLSDKGNQSNKERSAENLHQNSTAGSSFRNGNYGPTQASLPHPKGTQPQNEAPQGNATPPRQPTKLRPPGQRFIPYDKAHKELTVIRQSDGLTAAEYRIYAELLDRGGKSGFCFPTVERLAKDLHLHPKSVSRILRHLRMKGLIEAEKQLRRPPAIGQGPNRYWFLTPDLQLLQAEAERRRSSRKDRKCRGNPGVTPGPNPQVPQNLSNLEPSNTTERSVCVTAASNNNARFENAAAAHPLHPVPPSTPHPELMVSVGPHQHGSQSLRSEPILALQILSDQGFDITSRTALSILKDCRRLQPTISENEFQTLVAELADAILPQAQLGHIRNPVAYLRTRLRQCCTNPAFLQWRQQKAHDTHLLPNADGPSPPPPPASTRKPRPGKAQRQRQRSPLPSPTHPPSHTPAAEQTARTLTSTHSFDILSTFFHDISENKATALFNQCLHLRPDLTHAEWAALVQEQCPGIIERASRGRIHSPVAVAEKHFIDFCAGKSFVLFRQRFQENKAPLTYRANEAPPFSLEEVRLFLLNNAEALRARSDLEEFAIELEILAGNITYHYRDLEGLEQTLVHIENRLIAYLRRHQSEDDAKTALRDLRNELQRRPFYATPPEYADWWAEQSIGPRLLELNNLPRLSLFYLR